MLSLLMTSHLCSVFFLCAASLTCFTSCTSVEVSPISPENKMSAVKIRTNPKVIVSEFVPVLVDGFQRNGIATQIISETADVQDAYIVDYVAYKTWDFVTYMHQADVNVTKNGRKLGHAHYYLRFEGGLALTKFASTKSKMDPLLDQMLQHVKH
jgi:hypothetical protein